MAGKKKKSRYKPRSKRTLIGVNVERDDPSVQDLIKLWEDIPKGERGQVLRDALRVYTRYMQEQGFARGYVVKRDLEYELRETMQQLVLALQGGGDVSAALGRVDQLLAAVGQRPGGETPSGGQPVVSGRKAVRALSRPAAREKVADSRGVLDEHLIDRSQVRPGESVASEEEILARRERLRQNSW